MLRITYADTFTLMLNLFLDESTSGKSTSNIPQLFNADEP